MNRFAREASAFASLADVDGGPVQLSVSPGGTLQLLESQGLYGQAR